MERCSWPQVGQRRRRACGGLDWAYSTRESRRTRCATKLAGGRCNHEKHGATVSGRAAQTNCNDAARGFRVADISTLEWDERPAKDGEEPRRLTDITTAAGLQQSRARVWRYPAHSTGRRHRDHAQEEVFVVISGQLTMLLGDEGERADVGPGSVIAVDAMTPLQIRNEGDEELVVYAYGAPPLQEGADMLDDVPCRLAPNAQKVSGTETVSDAGMAS